MTTDAQILSFAEAMQGVVRMPPHGRTLPDVPKPPPLPRYLYIDEREALIASLRDPLPWQEDTDAESDASFVRNGISRQILRRLRRGEWRSQAELDLHGLTKAEARQELIEFLHACLRSGARCVRIIHGKGLRSKNREPVLKQHVRHWLTQHDDILAYVEARAVDGGSGAVIALLKSGGRRS